MNAMNVSAEIVDLTNTAYPPTAGITPWSIPKPFIVEPSSEYESAGNYEALIGSTVDWLIDATRDRPWQDVLPDLAAYPFNLFDYEADNSALSIANDC